MAGNGIVKRWQSLWPRGLGKDKAVRLLLWLGVAGMLLIALSEWLPHSRGESHATSVTLTADAVEEALERRIATLLRRVEGVGACQVMVTLESDGTAVYAADTITSTGADGAHSFSENYLTVDTDTGPAGLLLTHLQPTIKGVVVVCDGGGNAAVQQRVLQVVSTAFHISERRVCVVKQE